MNRSLSAIVLLFLIFIPSAGLAAPKVAILPWNVNGPEAMAFLKGALPEMLSTRLGASSLEIARKDEVKKAVKESKELNESLAFEAGKRLSADFVVFGSVTILGNSISMDAQVADVKANKVTQAFARGEGIDSVIPLTDRLSADLAAIVKGISPKEQQPGAPGPAATAPQASAPPRAPEAAYIKTRSIEGLFLGMAIADLDRDGVKEFYLMHRDRLVVAVIEGNMLKVVKEIREPGVTNVSVTAYDADGNGTPEVYLSRLRENRPDTAIIESRGGELRTVATGLKWLVRTGRKGAEGALIGQSFRSPDGFYGNPLVLKREGDALVEKGRVDSTPPGKINIYNYDSFDITGDGQPEIVSFDGRGHIRVYVKSPNGWEKDWQSREFFGGTLNHVELSGETDKEPFAAEGSFYQSYAGGGKPELVIKRNVPGGLGRYSERPSSFVEGEIIGLSWDTERLSEAWRTKKVEGYIADFVITDYNGDGAPEIVMLVVEGTEKLVGEPKSYVLSTRLGI